MIPYDVFDLFVKYGVHIPISTKRIIRFSEYCFYVIKVFTFSKIQCNLCKKYKKFTYYHWSFVYTKGVFCNEVLFKFIYFNNAI